MPKCQKSTAIANSLSAKTRATAADGGLRVAAQSATRCAAHGGGDVNANAVWILSESESLKDQATAVVHSPQPLKGQKAAISAPKKRK